MLDAGSTLLAVAQALRGPATVITASLDIAQCLSDRPEINLILLGGQWDARQRLFAGGATGVVGATARTSPCWAPARCMRSWG